MALTVLCVSFLAFLVMGLPVAIAIALSCLSAFWVEGFPLELAIQNMISGMNVFSFLAIPFFIFSGELMLMKAAAKAAKTTGVILLLIGVSTMLQYMMVILEIPDKTAQLLLSTTTNPYVMFFLINLLLFLLGTFMDMAATILICTPLFLPIALQMGMGPVQFGIVMLLNCALGLNTPPVGGTQFVGCAIGGVSIEQVMRTILPFYGALFAVMAVVTYVPWFSTWIPSLLKGVPVY